MSQIYLNINNQQAGPYDMDGVNQMLSANQVTPETLGWMQGMANWESLSSDTFKSLGVGLQTAGNLTQPATEQTQHPQTGQIASQSGKRQHNIPNLEKVVPSKLEKQSERHFRFTKQI